MNPRRRDQERLESLFEEAEALPPSERASWLERLRASEPELAAEIASLLEFDARAEARMRGIVDRAVADAAGEQHWPRQFGAYRVLRTIQSGGMGTVFEAVREQDYHKRVALKVAASAIGTPAWVERFQQERQILAGLDHPHIARFLDGGASAQGLPYFAMELVDGEPITDYVRKRDLTLRERVSLFRKVCAAVSYAHQSLVVHRDLKPANILVTGEGEPKLLDFGLAKLQSPLDPDAGLTQTAMPLLTPAYCSPEQVLGGKITTRVDVYLLGLVLFEILTGSQAHQLTGSSPAELQRAICEVPEPVPSDRAEARALRGDLDTIVARAIQKDPDRRYQSVEELNEDLGRYLEGLPILARPPAWNYRARKFVRRNWIPVSAAAAVAVAMIGGALAFAWEARIAERRFELARRLANVMLFDIHDRVEAMPGSTDLRETVSARAVEYLDALSKDAGRNYGLRRELAAGYVRLTSAHWRKYETAPSRDRESMLAMLDRALALLANMPASEKAAAALTEAQLLNRRGQLLAQSSKYEAARADFERALTIAGCTAPGRELCESRINALQYLVRLCLPPNDWQRMQLLLGEIRLTLTTYRQFGNETFHDWNQLSAVYLETQRLELQHLYKEAGELMQGALPIAERLQKRRPLPSEALSELARLYQSLGRLLVTMEQGTPAERIALFQKAAEFAQERVNLDSADSAAYFELGDIQGEMALAYEHIDLNEAVRRLHGSIETLLARPEVAASTLEPRILFYSNGQDAIRFLLRVDRTDDAVAIARRISSVISPALFLKLDLPRSEDAQYIQALWWAASEADQERVAGAPQLWLRAVHESQQALAHHPQDAIVQASAAFSFEGWAAWLAENGRESEAEPFRRESQSLWARLSGAFPDNMFLRTRVQGIRDSHHQ